MPAHILPAARLALAALTVSMCLFVSPALRADDSAYPYAGQSDYILKGVVRRVDPGTDHLTVVGDDDHVYIVDAYGADIVLADVLRQGATDDLERGMRVRASGTLVGQNLVEAQTVRVLDAVPHEGARPAPANDLAAGRTDLDGVVRLVDLDHGRITVAGESGERAVVDVADAAISLDGRAGAAADLERGMRVMIAGTRLPHGRLVADRVRVVPDAAPEVAPVVPVEAAPAPRPVAAVLSPAPRPVSLASPLSPDPQAILAALDTYTGILIDARQLPNMMRSPSPAVYGPEPGESLLYPDRAHVPTPDEVQDESIVRYYHTEAEAEAGVAGVNPLILPAQAVLSPAKDSVQLSADDMMLFNALEKRLHFSRTWKVGFLVPGNQ